MPHSLLVAGCLGAVATCYICMCGCISLMEFLSRLRAMAAIRHFPGIFPITFVLNQIKWVSLAVQQRERLFLLIKNSGCFYFRLNKTKSKNRGEGGERSLQKKEKLQWFMLKLCVFNLNTATVRADRENFPPKGTHKKQRQHLFHLHDLSPW